MRLKWIGTGGSLVALALVCVTGSPAGAQQDGTPGNDAFANQTGPGSYQGGHRVPGSSGTSSGDSTGSAAWDPAAHIETYVPQVDPTEYQEDLPAGVDVSSGAYMNQIHGRADEIVAAMNQPDPGAWFIQNCTAPCGILYGQFVQTPPPPTPRELAQTLLTQLDLDQPVVRTSPVNGQLVVGLPTWFWVEGAGTTPQEASTSDGFVSIRAVPAFHWSTGEGTVSCPGPGTPYVDGVSAPGAASPDCGHTYRHAGRHTLTATVSWTVTWYVGGVSQGQLPASSLSGSAPVAVSEIQTLVSRVG
jgi:hypothetical protein